MYSLRIREDGMREPHRHPITAEMGYVHSGSGRMTVMDPDGTLDTWYLKQSDVHFISRAYPHHIERGWNPAESRPTGTSPRARCDLQMIRARFEIIEQSLKLANSCLLSA
jgi:Cupin